MRTRGRLRVRAANPRGTILGTLSGSLLGTILGIVLATALAAIAAVRPARAAVRTRSVIGTPVAWHRRALTVVVTEADATAAPGLVPALRAAAASWGGVCTDVSITVDVRAAGEPPPVRADDTSWVLLRDEVRCGDPVRQTFCLQPESVALTTVFVRTAPGEPGDGEILDADIELNAAHHAFAPLDAGAGVADDRHHDFQSILTHELGHLLGFGHVCAASRFERELDGDGVAVPACEGATDSLRASVMFPTIPPGELRARTLSDDDVASLCAVYPRGEPSPRSSIPSNSGGDGGAKETSASNDGGVDVRRPSLVSDAAPPPEKAYPRARGCSISDAPGAGDRSCWPAIALGAFVTARRRRRPIRHHAATGGNVAS